MADLFIGMGANLGDREKNLHGAVERLQMLPHTRVIYVSSWRESPPEGGPPQRAYLNGVARLHTELPPQDLLERLQDIERSMGRSREGERWGPRPIDLDLLSYDDLIQDEPGLTLPHPRMHLRRFVLAPMAEIAPEWRHPVLKRSATELLKAL